MRNFWALTFAIFMSLSHAEEAVYKETLKKHLDHIFLDEKLRKTQIGVDVYSLSSGEDLYSLNPDKALSPASTIKILTSYVALSKLGNEFTFKTQALHDGSIQGGVLKGNLYLKGGGDPALVTERMYLLVENLLRSGIKEIDGNIVGDASIFSTKGDDERIIDTAADRPYNAPCTGLSFNYNTTTVYFRPGASVGEKVKIFPEPDTGFLEVVNKAKTVSGSANNLHASRKDGSGKDVLLIEGSLGINAGEQRSYFNISNGPLYAAYALKMMLQEQGVQVKGKILTNATPSSAKQLAELESLPLRELVMLMNKFSNNFMADSMVKILAAQFRGVPGTLAKGMEIVREEATHLGVNRNGFKMNSGSGLSRETKITAREFIDILKASYNDFAIFPELMTSLPIAAVDGTLKKRMKDGPAARKLRGKTGSIYGVSSLVGVVQTKGGELLAYAVLLNEESAEPGSLSPWQNYFGQALSEFTRPSSHVESH